MKNILFGNCLDLLKSKEIKSIPVALTFFDPPFNQNKKYHDHDDNISEEEYWGFMKDVLNQVYDCTKDGGTIYFMQREKNCEFVLRNLRETKWILKNIIIWKKKTSAVPVPGCFSKQYQIIAYASKGKNPSVFNKLRYDPPLTPEQKVTRENGTFLPDVWSYPCEDYPTDHPCEVSGEVWEDIKELTSGCFAGPEAIRKEDGKRAHEQQSPISLLLRIILSSSNVGDIVLDPFAGSGTTGIVAKQIKRNYIMMDNSPDNIKLMENRVDNIRKEDLVEKYYDVYSKCTANIEKIWGKK